MTRLILSHFLLLAALGPARVATADDNDYANFVRAQAAALRAGDSPPKTLGDWDRRRSLIRKGLIEALGAVPDPPPPLDPKSHGTLERDGYKIEKVSFQTMPGVRMTANLYLPKSDGKHAAILAVHGHWRGAKQDPVVQSRCLGAVKLGFVVLVVDAFGAGERGVGKALGEYHGEMTGATLFPAGSTLAGLQVHENRRALHYLRSRPEVDPAAIGVTGASGGGNQTMYAAALIDGLAAAAPVCSVGNYPIYLQAACCMCEVVPGALTFADEWGVLGQFAPKGLMIVSASKDALQFSVSEARKTIAGLEAVYRLYDRPANLKHAVFESGHDYNREMREAVYGWFTRHLKGAGDGSPIAEPALKTEDPETLRCFPGDSRPDDFMTLPMFAATEGRKLVASKKSPTDADAWKREAEGLRKTLVAKTLGGFPEVKPISFEESNNGGARSIRFEPEPGIELTADVIPGDAADSPRAILIDLDGMAHAANSPLENELRRGGWAVVRTELRATGRLAPPSDKVGRAPDHNSAEWGLWIGRPLLGQWVFDVRRLLDGLEKTDKTRPRATALIGIGPGGLVALAAAATDPRVSQVATVGTLASYISDEPYTGQRLGVIAPGILKEVGDVAHLAALIAPRRLVIAGGVSGGGPALTPSALRIAYAPALSTWSLLGAPDAIKLIKETDPNSLVKALK